MSYSYSRPLTYNTENIPLTYDNTPATIEQNNQNVTNVQNKPSSGTTATLTTAGAITGAVVGGIIGAKKNPCIINGNNINDRFATKAYEKYLRKEPSAGKEEYKQCNNMLKKINSVKSADELRTLFEENPDAAEEVCSALRKDPDEFLNHVTDRNLKSNKKTIKNKLEAANKTRIQDIKNDIYNYWNPTKKRFEKGSNPDKKLYRTIKSTYLEMKTASAAKVAAIGAIIGGGALFLISKLVNNKKSIQNNPY